MASIQLVNPAVHNSNTSKFKDQRLAVPHANDHRFPKDLALKAVRQFIQDHGLPPTPESWTAAGMTPSEKTIRRRFGSFQAAAKMVGA